MRYATQYEPVKRLVIVFAIQMLTQAEMIEVNEQSDAQSSNGAGD